MTTIMLSIIILVMSFLLSTLGAEMWKAIEDLFKDLLPEDTK